MKTTNRWKHPGRLTCRPIILAGLALLLAACGSGTENNREEQQQLPGTTNYSVYLPDGVETKSLGGDIDGFFAYAGSDSLPTTSRSTKAGAVAADGTRSMNASTSTRDVTGFIAERPAFNSETDAGQVLDGFQATILGDANVLYMTDTGRQSFPALSAALSTYSLTLSTAMQPTDLANTLVQYLGINAVDGTVTNLPSAAADEPFETDYTLLIGVIYYSQNDIVVMVALVPASLAGTYAHITGAMSSANNVASTSATTASQTDTFTAQGGGGLADFLFVIDNSGSMSNEQQAVSDAAAAFDAAISNSGLDYHIGIITTDSDVLVDGLGDGGFTADISEFTSDVMVGISGSGTETGIWYAEQSLLSSAQGDASDGTVTASGHPRAGASLSVIILSDEPSQYTRRSGGVAFDPNNNLFLDRGYRVYAIVEPTNQSTSQYDDLALATGGSVADIGDTSVFSTIMNNIATNAGGASSQFALTQLPIASTITVSINGTTVANSAVDGWTYNAASNSVVFHGTALPSGGDAVSVGYRYITGGSGANEGASVDEGSFANPVAISEGVPYAGTISRFGTSFYSFTASTTGTYTIGVTNVSSANMDLDWAYGEPGGTTALGYCVTDVASGDEICDFNLTAGVDYIVQVDEMADVTGGTFTLTVSAP